MATAAAAGAADFKYHVLMMDYVPDILEKRGPYRADHLGAAQKKKDEGKMVMAGALAEPVDTGMFVFKDSTPEEIEQYCKEDAYVKNGLVSGWTIRPWVVVVE